MDELSILLFILSFALLVATVAVILYDKSTGTRAPKQTSSGIPLPQSSMIGAQCPVGCTCFPNPDATTSNDSPTQICALLDNDTMIACPPECCQPTCVNQDVQGIMQRSTV